MLPKFLLQFFSRLRFPWLFAVTAAIFGFDLLMPDFMPFVDELLLGLMTLLLGAWKTRKELSHESAPAQLSDKSGESADRQEPATTSSTED